MFFTCVLLSEKDKYFYIGFTKDLKQRLEEHQRGSVIPTATKRPLKLIYYTSFYIEVSF
ncbi:MAG: GIY-YIG nuclease family protein [Deltaproteobacteria bacterium]|nr:GIY-YIG nuclease family protein [Deltaproteobacteria bacterium]